MDERHSTSVYACYDSYRDSDVRSSIYTTGGSDQNTGVPLSSSTTAFKVFIISDAISLFAACISILMFFSLLTARYAERDFLISLPRKLILGLFTLFISIATMMETFAATLVIILRKQASWVYIPVSILAAIPVLLFGWSQFSVFFDIVLSTYGRGIFRGRSKKGVLPKPVYSGEYKVQSSATAAKESESVELLEIKSYD
ncbi:hypothetical protein C5167_009950 [Papaver somniferum]|uniref:PGG domain-containing protein n=1 Tax=Papaver somniferum TaxID=3469 RepID=A0A4Y7K2R7_PAPSO|nr:hypothetical protein C5167_009950 [Papaver somniferum]